MQNNFGTTIWSRKERREQKLREIFWLKLTTTFVQINRILYESKTVHILYTLGKYSSSKHIVIIISIMKVWDLVFRGKVYGTNREFTGIEIQRSLLCCEVLLFWTHQDILIYVQISPFLSCNLQSRLKYFPTCGLWL